MSTSTRLAPQPTPRLGHLTDTPKLVSEPGLDTHPSPPPFASEESFDHLLKTLESHFKPDNKILEKSLNDSHPCDKVCRGTSEPLPVTSGITRKLLFSICHILSHVPDDVPASSGPMSGKDMRFLAGMEATATQSPPTHYINRPVNTSRLPPATTDASQTYPLEFQTCINPAVLPFVLERLRPWRLRYTLDSQDALSKSLVALATDLADLANSLSVSCRVDLPVPTGLRRLKIRWIGKTKDDYDLRSELGPEMYSSKETLRADEAIHPSPPGLDTNRHGAKTASSVERIVGAIDLASPFIYRRPNPVGNTIMATFRSGCCACRQPRATQSLYKTSKGQQIDRPSCMDVLDDPAFSATPQRPALPAPSDPLKVAPRGLLDAPPSHGEPNKIDSKPHYTRSGSGAASIPDENIRPPQGCKANKFKTLPRSGANTTLTARPTPNNRKVPNTSKLVFSSAIPRSRPHPPDSCSLLPRSISPVSGTRNIPNPSRLSSHRKHIPPAQSLNKKPTDTVQCHATTIIPALLPPLILKASGSTISRKTKRVEPVGSSSSWTQNHSKSRRVLGQRNVAD